MKSQVHPKFAAAWELAPSRWAPARFCRLIFCDFSPHSAQPCSLPLEHSKLVSCLRAFALALLSAWNALLSAWNALPLSFLQFTPSPPPLGLCSNVLCQRGRLCPSYPNKPPWLSSSLSCLIFFYNTYRELTYFMYVCPYIGRLFGNGLHFLEQSKVHYKITWSVEGVLISPGPSRT